ncbi:MAG TPA: aminotransferase class III-fold pyridoxal phosphate-dependent enzyme, partial [Roseiflexaceae bacterium]|nr:aminotransferase class III-fold pyridoxal phosphate-dependent enzyme [Roseiflexaceae bacterium]
CAAAVATIAAIREDGMVDNATRTGSILKEELGALRGKHPSIGDVRGLGLMIGVELVAENDAPNGALAKQVLAGARERGLLLLNCGPYDNVIRFIPPLVVDESQVRQAVKIFEEALHV